MKSIRSHISVLIILALAVSLLSGCGATPPPEYTVTFDLNGGELVSGELIQIVTEGENAVPPGATNGRKELSWEGSWENITADTTVTAKWTKVAMDTEDLAEYVQERTVTINVETILDDEQTGSGFFISNDGVILTNFHVIDLAKEITVEAGNGAKYSIEEIVGFDDVKDIAILKINKNECPYLELSDEEVRTGQKVFAVGSSLGILTGSFTDGTVSSVRRKYGVVECIQMSTPISSGNSGGPLVNIYGEAVGVNTASYVDGENLNLAIKIATVNEIGRDRHFTMKDFVEWYDKQSSRSWSPCDPDGYYYYSLVNNYQTVTNVDCINSYSSYEDSMQDGYVDMCDLYIYSYDTQHFDEYIEYLKSIGFEYQSSEPYEDGKAYIYYNPVNYISINMLVYENTKEIWVAPTIYY